MTSRETTTSRLFAPWALAVALVLSACATTPPQTKEDAVRARATQRAEAYVKGDLPAAYGLMTPSYRKIRDLDAWRRGIGQGARWEGAEVSSVACTEQRCIVGLKVRVKPLILGMFNDTITVQFEETWLLEDGNWWLHQAL
jgi:hypothetical protein